MCSMLGWSDLSLWSSGLNSRIAGQIWGVAKFRSILVTLATVSKFLLPLPRCLPYQRSGSNLERRVNVRKEISTLRKAKLKIPIFEILGKYHELLGIFSSLYYIAHPRRFFEITLTLFRETGLTPHSHEANECRPSRLSRRPGTSEPFWDIQTHVLAFSNIPQGIVMISS